ncbi:MAG: helix-turn-helix domain-containing protein [Bryobacterales bacterium]|nr:helix-turn-helix domain-containing protein [Bryobacterales bacterium]
MTQATQATTVDKVLLNEHEAAHVLGMQVRTLQRWRCLGRGPSFVKVGGYSVRYDRRDLMTWLDSQPRIGGGNAA